MLDDNKIQDIFTKASLENEDWLEPSPMVFQNLENAIYSKKRKRWFWLIPLFGLLALLGYLQFESNNSLDNSLKNITKPTTNITKQVEKQNLASNQKEKNESISTLEKKELLSRESLTKKTLNTETLEILNSETINKTTNNKKGANSTLKTEDKLAEKVNLKTTISKINSSSNVVVKNELDKNKTSSKSNTLNKKDNSKVNITSKNLSVVDDVFIESQEKTFVSVINKSTLITNNKDIALLEQGISNKSKTTYQNEDFISNKSIDKLQSILPSLTNYEKDHITISTIDTEIPQLLKQATTDWQIGILSGFSFWDYSLNNNFKSALQPADFEYKNSKGYFVAVSATKMLNKKFSFITDLNFETVYNQSGHNSEIEYKAVNENSEAVSSYDIKMASTLGFIDTNLKIQRQNDVNLENTSFIVDLNNKHKISSIDLSTYLAANVININKTNLSLRLGLGLAQIISIKNELTSFSTSLPALKAYKSEITANQKELNRTRLFIAFGGNFVHQLSTTNSLFVTYSFKSDFNALYQSGEFSTFLNKHNVGLGYLKHF